MTLRSISGPIFWPPLTIIGSPALATQGTLDAAGEYITYIFQAREAMTISHVAFRTGAVVASGAGEIRIETMATDGTASGNLWAANTNVLTGALTSTTTALFALGASASITAGAFFAVVILYTSGTSFIVQALNNVNESNFCAPYFVTNTSGSAVKTQFNNMPIIALGSNSTTFYSLGHPAMAVTAVSGGNFNNTNAAARGLRFQVPFKCRAIGLTNITTTTTGDFNAVLYNDAGTELSSSSTAIDGDYNVNASTGMTLSLFDNPVTLSPSTWYRAAIEPSTATNTNVSTVTLLSADYRSGTPWGSNAHYTTRASGSWDDTNTNMLPWMQIVIDQLDDGTVATQVTSGNMTGGLQ